MTDRERWTVYPLIFLTLGIAVKDKISRAIDTDELHCKRLVCKEVVEGGRAVYGEVNAGAVNAKTVNAGVVQAKGAAVGEVDCNVLMVKDAAGQEQVLLTSTPQGGGLIHTRGTVLVTDQEGRHQVLISSNENGGQVRTIGTLTGIQAVLGNTDRVSGLLFVDAKGQVRAGPVLAGPPNRQAPPATEKTHPEKTESRPEDAPTETPTEEPAPQPTKDPEAETAPD